MSWADVAVAAVQVAGTAYAANQAGKAAGQAGQDASATADKNNALAKYIYDDQRALNMPFYQGGLQAFDQYRLMMGLPVQQGGAQGGGYNVPQAMPSEWLKVSGGVPQVNDELYATDPRYKAAWDQATLEHRNSHNGAGYGAGSDQGAIKSRLQALYGQGTQQTQAPVQANPQSIADMLRNTPGYQFRVNEGLKGVQASAAARGGLMSGATMKALNNYAQGQADQTYGDHMNRLAKLWGGGETASQAVGAAGGAYANNVMRNNDSASQARQQSTYGKANAQMWGIQQAGNYLGNAYGAYQQRQNPYGYSGTGGSLGNWGDY